MGIKMLNKNVMLDYSDYLVSGHEDEKLFTVKEIMKFDLLEFFYYSVDELFYKERENGVVATVKINSAYRTEKINKLVKGAKNSQHKFIEAMDLSFFRDGRKITGEDLKKIAREIDKVLDFMILQLIVYDRFIHFGLVTTDAIKRGVRFRRKGL